MTVNIVLLRTAEVALTLPLESCPGCSETIVSSSSMCQGSRINILSRRGEGEWVGASNPWWERELGRLYWMSRWGFMAIWSHKIYDCIFISVVQIVEVQ